MPQNAYLLPKIGADTAENERHFAEILPIGRRVALGPPGCRGPAFAALKSGRGAAGGAVAPGLLMVKVAPL